MSDLNKPSKEIMQYRGKIVSTDMTKEELLEVIAYLAAEMLDARGELNKYSDVIYSAKIEQLDLGKVKHD